MASISGMTAIRDGDTVAVTGFVDGESYTVRVWFSHLATLSTVLQKRTYCAQELKKAADLAAPKPAVDLSGSAIIIP